jgi:transposase
MTEQLTMTTERVDDIPVLLAQSEKMGIVELLDTSFQPHGNWEGTSLGLTTTIWLTHILSEGDHRMNQVQPWAATRLQTLQKCSGRVVRDQEWSDDRLSIVLDALSDDQQWQHFETALNQQLVRVYNLKPKCVRVDSTTASGYWTVTEEGLFQLGYSKDHRPDLPQRKRDVVGAGSLGLASGDADRVGGTSR